MEIRNVWQVSSMKLKFRKGQERQKRQTGLHSKRLCSEYELN